MDRGTANKVLVMLKGYYPRQYPANLPDDQCRFIVEDLCDSLSNYENEDVLKAYKDWHLESSFPPTVADILRTLKSDHKYQPEAKQYEIFVKDGIEYAREVKK